MAVRLLCFPALLWSKCWVFELSILQSRNNNSSIMISKNRKSRKSNFYWTPGIYLLILQWFLEVLEMGNCSFFKACGAHVSACLSSFLQPWQLHSWCKQRGKRSPSGAAVSLLGNPAAAPGLHRRAWSVLGSRQEHVMGTDLVRRAWLCTWHTAV